MGGNANSGRKTKKWNKAHVKYAMVESAQQAAGYIKAVLSGKIVPDWKLLDAAKFCINHELGLPRQRAEVSGPDGRPLLTYPELVILAAKALALAPVDDSKIVEEEGTLLLEKSTSVLPR